MTPWEGKPAFFGFGFAMKTFALKCWLVHGNSSDLESVSTISKFHRNTLKMPDVIHSHYLFLRGLSVSMHGKSLTFEVGNVIHKNWRITLNMLENRFCLGVFFSFRESFNRSTHCDTSLSY